MRSSSFCTAPGLLASALWLLSSAGGIGCSESTERHFISLDEDAYLRGEQVVTIDVSSRLGGRRAVRTELFLDGQRIAADELAPFELAWDTRDFADGDYELQARVYLDDDGRFDDALAIHIDNTAPALGELPRTMVQSQLLDIPASDNIDVARVEVSRRVAGEPPTVLVARPFQFRWPWPCGAVALQVRVIDRAGGEIVRSFDVASIETLGDEDCDHYTSLASGGSDCNDADPSIHVGAFEYLDGVDRNCNGVPGPPPAVDADGDGVASTATGGADCNDGSPAVHGRALVLGHRDLVVDNTPLTWSPGEVALGGFGFSGAWQLFLNKDGVVSRIRPGGPEAVVVDPVATGANRGSVYAADSLVGFGRGNQVVVMSPGMSGWLERTVIPADGRVGAVAFQLLFMGQEYVAFQADTKVYFASLAGADVLRTQLVVDAGEPIIGQIELWATPGAVSMAFRTATKAWKVERTGTTELFTVRTFGAPDRVPPSAVAAYTNFVFLMAVDHGTGSALYDDKSSAPLLHFPRRITSLDVNYPYVYVHLEGLGTQVLSIPGRYARVQMLPEARRFDTMLGTGDVFAASGYIEFATPATIVEAVDLAADSVDMDCDGSDS
jgi:hypothetical protein